MRSSNAMVEDWVVWLNDAIIGVLVLQVLLFAYSPLDVCYLVCFHRISVPKGIKQNQCVYARLMAFSNTGVQVDFGRFSIVVFCTRS